MTNTPDERVTELDAYLDIAFEILNDPSLVWCFVERQPGPVYEDDIYPGIS